MKLEEKKYWHTLENIEVEDEFPALVQEVPFSRRNFLKTVGFCAMGSMAACTKMSIEKAIPFAIQPEDAVLGESYWYASTCSACTSACGTLVKTRDGRPIKIEGNSLSPINQGGLCAAGQADVLDLYDSGRLKGPLKGTGSVTWDQLDAEVLEKLKSSKKKIRVLSETIVSPTLRHTIEKFTASFPGGKHVVYDSFSYSALIQSQQACFGKNVVPQYKLDRADVIVSFGADFLATWISPVEFAKQYSKRRRVEDRKGEMLRHIQFESRLSLTGANADQRLLIKPSELSTAVAKLIQQVEEITGVPTSLKSSLHEMDSQVTSAIKKLASELVKTKGSSLIMSDSNDLETQNLISKLNYLLGNVGTTVLLNTFSNQRMGDDTSLNAFMEEVIAGEVGVLVLCESNPVYHFSANKEFLEALKKIPLLISLNARSDETASLAHYQAPAHHGLESWGDAEPIKGTYHLFQPVIQPVFDTRHAGDTFLRWQGNATAYQDHLKTWWNKNVFSKQTVIKSFQMFWETTVRDGVFVDVAAIEAKAPRWKSPVVSSPTPRKQMASSEFEIDLFESTTLRTGRSANNPWLQELPDPITKVTWDNYALISVDDAKELHIENGTLILISNEQYSVEIPAYVQPGQARKVISIALGYGRTHVGKAGNGIGKEVFSFVKTFAKNRQFTSISAKIKVLERLYPLALTQTHMSAEGRPIVQEVTKKEFLSGALQLPQEQEKLPMLWKAHETEQNSWGMAIDLNSCIGCSSCLIGCQSENNIPVVGKEEVRLRREMSWIRVDRYYSGSETNPDVIFQPMMCQHCDNAPCESVCPVLATVHSSDGLNQQVYNRCIGTRYCANNCPYKVRRFNWFDYANNKQFDYNMNDDAGRLVLNPDVVVRSRGVMEKCSLCVQRIQEAKLEAKKNGEPLVSDRIQTACQQSCPSDAIVFGDLRDTNSKLSKMLSKNPRRFHVLAELNVRPSVTYLAKVRNNDE